MNILKNMEAIFIVAVALACATAFAAPAPVRAPAQPAAASNAKMIKVVITGKRLTAAQKARQPA